MALTRPKGSKVYVMDFMFHGQRIRETTGMRSITRAREVEDKRKQALRDGAAGIRRAKVPRLFSYAAVEWQGEKESKWSESMCSIAAYAVGHLLPVLGKKLLVDIEAGDIAKYQGARIKQGASPATVNIEVRILRQIMIKHKTWERIKSDVTFFRESDDVGRALTAEEEATLLDVCGLSRSRILRPFVTLALETGARYNTIRTLQWLNIDFVNGCIKFGKDKTPSGTGRTIPLNQRAAQTLSFWAQQFPNRRPSHYVFPIETCGMEGMVETFGFNGAVVYKTDPSQPIGEVKEAWERAKKHSQRVCPVCKSGIVVDHLKPAKGHYCESCQWQTDELPAGLVAVRFHDLRHTAVSRMIAARIPLPIIAKIVGWSAGTMAKMALRYGHFPMEELRGAVESISSPKIKERSPLISPQPKEKKEMRKSN